MLVYPSSIDLSSRTLRFLTRQLTARQAKIGTRWRRLLGAMGVVAVSVGELEGFAPTLGVAKGPAWLSAALEAGAHKESAAQRHVAALVKVLSDA